MTEIKSARARAGVVTSAVGIACNLVLAAAKIAVGAVFGLFSVMADGFNNFSDCGGSAVSLASFKIAEKPADEKHPYGHRRAEYVASMIIAFLVLFLAAELLRESIGEIISGGLTSGSAIVYAVLGGSIAVKCALAVYYGVEAKRLQSDALRAEAVDSGCDCIATAAVVAGVLISEKFSVAADGYVSLAVALFIVWQGVKLLVEASSKLLGQAPEKGLVSSIKSIILTGEHVLGVHDLKVYGYGKGVYYATAHIEFDASCPSMDAHAVIDGLEHRVKEELGVELCAHLDPVDLCDGEARRAEKLIRESVAGIAEGLEVHDFKVVRGVKPKIIFEAAVPFSCKLTDGEVRAAVEEAAGRATDFLPVVTVERE